MRQRTRSTGPECDPRREALKKFGLGLAGVALASLGLANKAEAGPKPITRQECIKICIAHNCAGLSGAAERECKHYCQSVC